MREDDELVADSLQRMMAAPLAETEAEQQRIPTMSAPCIIATINIAGNLQVDMFKPCVIALPGPELAGPLSPPEGNLRMMLEGPRKSFNDAFRNTADQPDRFVVPAPRLTISSGRGGYSACEDFIVESRKIELRGADADATACEQETKHLVARIWEADLEGFSVGDVAVRVRVEEPA